MTSNGEHPQYYFLVRMLEIVESLHDAMVAVRSGHAAGNYGTYDSEIESIDATVRLARNVLVFSDDLQLVAQMNQIFKQLGKIEEYDTELDERRSQSGPTSSAPTHEYSDEHKLAIEMTLALEDQLLQALNDLRNDCAVTLKSISDFHP